MNSPVVAGGSARRGPGGHRHRAPARTPPTSPSSPTGAPRWGPRSREAGNFPGLLQSTEPGQLSLTGVPREAGVHEGQVVVTGGFSGRALESPYPPRHPRRPGDERGQPGGRRPADRAGDALRRRPPAGPTSWSSPRGAPKPSQRAAG